MHLNKLIGSIKVGTSPVLWYSVREFTKIICQITHKDKPRSLVNELEGGLGEAVI